MLAPLHAPACDAQHAAGRQLSSTLCLLIIYLHNMYLACSLLCATHRLSS
jgi:hypothetical protein